MLNLVLPALSKSRIIRPSISGNKSNMELRLVDPLVFLLPSMESSLFAVGLIAIAQPPSTHSKLSVDTLGPELVLLLGFGPLSLAPLPIADRIAFPTTPCVAKQSALNYKNVKHNMIFYPFNKISRKTHFVIHTKNPNRNLI